MSANVLLEPDDLKPFLLRVLINTSTDAVFTRFYFQARLVTVYFSVDVLCRKLKAVSKCP